MTTNRQSAKGKNSSSNGNVNAVPTLAATSNFKFLKPIKFNRISFWDTKRYFAEDIKSNFPIETLGKFIIEQREIIKPSNYPNKIFKILGVSNKVGLFDAYEEVGSKIKQPYQKVKNGFLAYNPYRINVGSIGFKTEAQKNEYISNAYIVFSCRDEIEPEFLYRLFETSRFNQVIRNTTAGSVRQNLSFNLLQEMQVPIPPIETQKTLLAEYNARISQAEKFKTKAENLEKEIEKYLLDELGIEIQKNENEQWHNFKFLQSSQLKELNRWSVDFLANQSDLEEIRKSKFDIVNFEELILFAQYGISEKSTVQERGVPMLRMNNIFEGELNLNSLKYVNLAKEKLENLFLQKDDFLFNRTNSKELVGKTAIFDTEGEYTFASYLIRLKLDQEKANIYFINYIFNSPIIRRQIDIISRQVLGQANINLTELKSFLIPLPPLSTQEKIVKKVNSLKAKIKKLKSDEENLRRKAKDDFESELFEM